MRIETQKKWRTLIKQHTDSDSSIGMFCKDKRISQVCLFKYRKIILATVNTDTRTAFVKLQPAKVSDSCDMIKIQYHNSTLSLPATITPDWQARHYFCESLFWASQPKQAAKITWQLMPSAPRFILRSCHCVK